jgi:hypothetical protein
MKRIEHNRLLESPSTLVEAFPGTSPDLFQHLTPWQEFLYRLAFTRLAQSRASYRKHNNHIRCTLDYDCKIEPNLKTFEGFMDDNVLNLRGRDKPCSRS